MLGWVRTDKCRDVLAKPNLHLAGIRKKHKGVSHEGEKLQTVAPREDHNPPPLCLGVVPPWQISDEIQHKGSFGSYLHRSHG